MKKILIAGLIAFCMLGITGLASAETTVETSWNGAGYLDIDFQSGDDAKNLFKTSGAGIVGSYYAKDSDNNPYGYGVDSTKSEIKASVVNGAMEYQYYRTDSKNSMYGPAGQSSYSFLGSDGTASFAWKTTSNFAAMKSSNYGFQSSNQFTATGNHFLQHGISTENSQAIWTINATGTSSVSHMSDEASGSSSFKFGKGCGCYTNAKVNVVGSGTYDLVANAPNQIKTDTGITTDGHLSLHADFSSGFSFGNFALSGN
jgi:hypothetical protein